MKRLSRSSLNWAFIGLIALILISLYLSLFRNALIDDAYITFQYARNLRDYGTWGFFPHTTTNTATSALNVMLTALVGIVIPDMVDAAMLLATIESLGLFLCLLVISKRILNQIWPGIISFVGTITNPLLVSTFGLETLLYILLVVVSLYSFLEKKWSFLAVSLALLTLTRADGILLFLVMFIFLIYREKVGSSQIIQFMSIYITCLLPWYIFSWVQLGSLMPDTFLLKVHQNWWGFNYLSGLGLYLYRYPFAFIPSFAFVPFGFFVVWRKKGFTLTPSGGEILLVFGVAYFFAYVILQVPPYHWYYTPVAVSLNLTGIFSLSTNLSNSGERTGKQRIFNTVLIATLAFSGAVVTISQAGAFPLQEPPIHTNWGTGGQYKEIGTWLKDNLDIQDKIKLEGEIGTLAFYSERQLLDMFSCRYEQQEKIKQLKQQGDLLGILARINYRWYETGEPCLSYDFRLAFAPPGDILPSPDEVLIKSWIIRSNWMSQRQVILWKSTDR